MAILRCKPFNEAKIASMKIKNSDDEYVLVRNLLSQVSTWMTKNHYHVTEVNSLLVNKVLYFIAQELNKKNPNIVVSGGWYRYGPCLEIYRKDGEEGTQNLSSTQCSEPDKILPEVRSICEEQVPRFFESKKKDDIDRYPYNYLKYIYTTKSEYPKLNRYYINKNELAYQFFRFAFTKKAENLEKAFVNFQLAILDEDYANFVKLGKKTQETVFDYLVVMQKLVTLQSTYKKDDNYWFVVQKIAQDFNKNVLAEFSYKNYIVTYKDINKFKEMQAKKAFSSQADTYESNMLTSISSNIEWINHLQGE